MQLRMQAACALPKKKRPKPADELHWWDERVRRAGSE
jgi:hypothetical protein